MSDLQADIDVFHSKIRFQSPVADGAQHLAPHVMTGDERLAIERVVEAARKYANLDIEAAAVVLWDAAFPRGVHWRKLLPETREKYLALAAEAFDAALGVTVTEENE